MAKRLSLPKPPSLPKIEPLDIKAVYTHLREMQQYIVTLHRALEQEQFISTEDLVP